MGSSDDDKEQPPLVAPQQSSPWFLQQMWQPPPRRPNAGLDVQQSFVLSVPPPPQPPEGTPPTGGRDEEINAAFQEVLRRKSELNSAFDRLRNEVTALTDREIGIGHNQGPVIVGDLNDHQIQVARIPEKAASPTPADRIVVVEQAEKTKQWADQIRDWLQGGTYWIAGIAVTEVTKKLTAPLWEEVVRRIYDLYHAIEIWVSLLPPL